MNINNSSIYNLSFQENVNGVSSNPSLFSPNGDGIKDNTTFKFEKNGIISVDNWTLEIGEDGEILNLSGDGEPSDFIWDGKDKNGNILPDGDYTFRIYSTGNGLEGETEAFTIWQSWFKSVIRIDTVPPVVKIDTIPSIFSPNDDMFYEETFVFIDCSDISDIAQTRIKILNEFGEEVLKKEFDGKILSFMWNGKDNNGITLPDGYYKIIVEATDMAGNMGISNEKIVIIDTTPPITTSHYFPSYNSSNFFIGPQTEISLNSYDLYCSTIATYYSIDEGDENNYMATFKLSDISETYHTLNYYSIDCVGNIENKKTDHFIWDATPPVSTISYEPYILVDGNVIVLPETIFTIDSIDPLPITSQL